MAGGQWPEVASGQKFTVRVPATSANLGPGFDSLGLALDWYDTLTIETFGGAGLQIEIRGIGEDWLPRDSSHLAVRCLDEFLSCYRYRRAGLRLVAENNIPHGRGLGSSAAVIVAALTAARRLLPPQARPGVDAVFEEASRLEGHPDNVAPALYGGLSISWSQDMPEQRDDFQQSAIGRERCVVVPTAERLCPVVAVPGLKLATRRARAMLPRTVPHRDAAANSGRAALLIHALSNEPSLLLPATRDYLHQEARAAAMPKSLALLRHWRDAGIAAVISGAGPTVLALTAEPEQARRAVELAGEFLGDNLRSTSVPGAEVGALSGRTGEVSAVDEANWCVRTLEIAAEGAKISDA